ncbi:MAG: alpha/beta fold hydrolase [Pseudomonadota bacterium]
MILYWILVLLAGVIAVPIVQEFTRNGVASRQGEAPGSFAELPRGTLHYRWFGPERGPVLVCVHGLTTSSYVWDGMVQGLALMGYRVLVFDHYGRGYSDRPFGRQSAAFFVSELEELLAHESVQGPVTLMGYSMGGAIAAAFAAAHPARCVRIVLLASAGMQNPPGGLAGVIRTVPVVGDWLMLALYPWILRKGIAAERGLPSAVPDIGAKQVAELDVRGFVPAVLSSLRGILSTPLEDAHRAIHAASIPVHAIWGAQDALIPASAHKALGQWNPDAVQDVLEDGTHAITYTHADEILALIRAQAA